ncbi:MAG: glycosyltransferase [Verrucomicrobiota bacterium]
MNPIVVILPVFNGLPHLKQAVESVLAQSFRSFDFLILDDCSTDGSWEYLSGLQDPRITLSRNAVNKGLFYNLNRMIQRSSSQLVKLWAQDDIMYANCLQEILSFHARYPNIGFSYTARDIIDQEGRVITPKAGDHTPELISTELHARIAFFVGSIAGNIANVTLSRAALEKVGLFREDMRISGDFDMWVRLAREHPVGFIQSRLVQLRDHADQASRQERHFIFHLKEDLEVYHYLLGYVSPGLGAEGRRLLRRFKLLFYYTLMVKAALKGHLRTAAEFLLLLSRFDNIAVVTLSFVWNRVLRAKRYRSALDDNAGVVIRNP